jgi:hypothetical protein
MSRRPKGPGFHGKINEGKIRKKNEGIFRISFRNKEKK